MKRETTDMLCKAFTTRYFVERVGPGSVLVDVESGTYYQLNKTATLVCEALSLAPSFAEAVDSLAKTLASSGEAASDLASSMLEKLGARPPAADVPLQPFRYVYADGAYALEENGRKIVSISRDGRQVKICADPKESPLELSHYLRVAAPKIIRLQGRAVLHAAACSVDGRLRAFSGKSGAGKTTMAHAFSAAGAKLISEDLLLLQSPTAPVIYEDGERLIREWAVETADRLTRTGARTADCDAIESAGRGPTVTLDTVWLVAATRRAGDAFTLRSMSALEGFAALLDQSFLATLDLTRLRSHISSTKEIAGQLSLSEATVPSGLKALGAAARAYRENWTS